MYVIYIGAQKNGIRYQRMVYGILDLMSNTGGFLNSIFKVFSIVTGFMCTVLANSKLLQMMLEESIKESKDRDNMEKLIGGIQSWGFQFRMLFQKIICRNFNCVKKCCLKNDNFKELHTFYQRTCEDIFEELTLSMYLKHMT